MSKIEYSISVDDLIEKFKHVYDARGEIIYLFDIFGGRDNIIDIFIKWFMDKSNENDLEKYIDVFGEILFEHSGSSTYFEDWDNYWDKIKDLPLKILVDLLLIYKPGKHRESHEDVALNYLLSNKYNENEATLEIYEELKDYFIDEQPKKFIEFREKQHFIDELKLFNDLNFIEDKYTKIYFGINEIKELLKEIVISRKLENFHQIKLFLILVNWYAPENRFDRKYKDAFVLEIFEVDDNSGIPMWSDEVIDLWKEEFYNIDFDWSNSEIIKDQINSSCKTEANYISERLKINPNYRHD